MCAFRVGVWPGPYRAGGPVSSVRGGEAPAEHAARGGFDLKTFFTVIGKDPVQVTAADMFEFLAHQGDRTVVRARSEAGRGRFAAGAGRKDDGVSRLTRERTAR